MNYYLADIFMVVLFIFGYMYIVFVNLPNILVTISLSIPNAVHSHVTVVEFARAIIKNRVYTIDG